MRTLLLVGAVAVLGACASSSPSTGASAFQSRLPAMRDVVKAARAESWGAGLQQIPATVIDVGDLANVPYVSFAGKDIELNVYGDPAAPAGIELGTKDVSPEVRAAVRAFIGKQLGDADKAPLAGLPDGKEVENNGLALEITPPEAADGFGAWWVTAFHPVAIKQAQASVGEMSELALEPNDEFNAALAVPDVSAAPGFIRYPRYRGGAKKIYATNYYKENGVYRRRK
jgi:hypothetical protein